MSSARCSATPTCRPAARFRRQTATTTLAGVVLRTGYEISPALTPFVELEYGQRFYDIDVDSNGFDRAATVAGARAGLELDLGEKLSGEFSGGWINEDLADPRLASISGPSVNADLDLVADARHHRSA